MTNNIDNIVKGISRDSQGHGDPISISCTRHNGPVNVKYSDGYMNSYISDMDGFRGWEDHNERMEQVRELGRGYGLKGKKLRLWTN